MSGETAPVECELARRLRVLSRERWGRKKETILIGRDERFCSALDKVVRLAASDCPVLLLGETGAGKELFARSVFLSSARRSETFLAINCAQYVGEQLITSQLFGHRTGSFTGAVGNHKGVFEVAEGGVLFLDEISELPLPAQAMLLRAISEGEILPVGGTQPRSVNVRVVAATNRDLPRMVDEGTFRKDLYYRLGGHAAVEVPPLRRRGDDWRLIATYFLGKLGRRHGVSKRFSQEAVSSLRGHDWPGNVREVKTVVETGYHLSAAEVIALGDIGGLLEERTRQDELSRMLDDDVKRCCDRMANGGGSFWDVIRGPFLDRELNRQQVQAVISFALDNLTAGNYKEMLLRFGVAEGEYLKAMDFLRHHRLKPDDRASEKQYIH